MGITIPLEHRISRLSMPVTECGCWIWIGARRRDGYGALTIEGKQVAAHRAAWLAFKGSLPPGSHVLHTCDVRSCVNPDHLWLGDHTDNMRDRRSKRLAGATIKHHDIGFHSTRKPRNA